MTKQKPNTNTYSIIRDKLLIELNKRKISDSHNLNEPLESHLCHESMKTDDDIDEEGK